MTATFSPITDPIIDQNELITGEAVALSVRPASFLLRAAGTIIDVLVSILVIIGLFWFLGRVAMSINIDEPTGTALSIIIVVFGLVILPSTVEILTRGRSLGKLAVGVRIVRDDGGAIQYRHALTRALVGVLELYMTLGGLAAIVGLLSDRSKRLGDMVAGTYSQHERVPHVRRMVRPLPPELAGWATVADVARMPEPLERRISQFLAQADRFTPESRQRLATELAGEAAAYTSPIPPVHPETLLVAIAAIRRDRDARSLDAQARRLAAVGPALTGNPHGFSRY